METTNDKKKQLAMKWVSLLMEFNRNEKMKIVEEELDKRAGSDKLRGIQMKPFLHMWKQAEYKKTWRKFMAKLVRRENQKKMGLVPDSKMNERTEKAVEYFTNIEKITSPKINNLIPESRFGELEVIQRAIPEEEIVKEEKKELVQESARKSAEKKKTFSLAFGGAAAFLILVFIILKMSS